MQPVRICTRGLGGQAFSRGRAVGGCFRVLGFGFRGVWGEAFIEDLFRNLFEKLQSYNSREGSFE